MKRKHHLILYSFLSFSLILSLAVAFLYSYKAQKNAQMLESTYTQRLLEAQEHLQAVGAKLGKTAASGGVRVQVELLSGISRQADNVVSDLTALPLSHVAMSNAVRFCNQLSEYALMQALRCAGGDALTPDDRQKMRQLESQCVLLTGQLAAARGSMQTQSLQMAMDESVFYQPAQLSERPLEKLGDPDGGMDYPSMIYDGAFSDARYAGRARALGGETITAQQAVGIAARFIGEERIAKAEPGVETGGAIPCFGVTLTLHDGTVLNADVTRQGGRLLWIMPEHASFSPGLTLEECTQKAQAFLQSRGYGPMEANHYQVYDGLAVINFAAVQDGVLLYPDLIKVQLRMDTGELVGLESNNYLMNHGQREDLSPSLLPEQALARTGDRLAEKSVRLCVIPYRSGEKLCWEVSGWYEDSEYRVYVDAHTGEELEVLKMIREPMGEFAV